MGGRTGFGNFAGANIVSEPFLPPGGAMNVGVDAKGYQILVVICASCGHSG